ncbi:MAG: hypothetical protein QOJ22_1188 [Thermoleophilaceae bacterium]|jgi:hypothetical protein|nr:hypothetical protein [Thermoleophilaceae bacterium]
MKGRIKFALGAMLVLAVAAGAAALTGGANASPPDAIQAAKAASAKFHSIQEAEAAGYVLASPCVESPAGGMGFHYENPALMADDAIDPAKPEVLVYAPKGDGKLELVAIEFWKRDADGSLITDGDRPAVLGQSFDGPMPGHSPVMPVHYDLHVWVYEANESGTFAQFNPAVSC